jgi:formylglycine-generating enzyme
MKFTNKTVLLLLAAAFGGLFSSCDEDVSATLKTYSLYNATSSSCMIRATVDVVGDDIEEAGFLLTTSASITLGYNNCARIKSDGSRSDFIIKLEGLSADSSYRFRLYAKSADSVYYGSTYGFKPIPMTINTVRVTGGAFSMGATTEQTAYAEEDEFPIHQVEVSDFLMGTTEVTNAQFVQFLKSRKIASGGSAMTEFGETKTLFVASLHGLKYDTDSATWTLVPGYENNPVVRVTWYGANEFCRWAGGRLPTEAEWEWAAREGTQARGKLLSGGDSTDVNAIAWYKQNTKDMPTNFKDTQPVGTKTPNLLGLYDMSGNVWEWVNDWYNPYLTMYQTNPTGMSDDDAEESSVVDKVLRGGSWADGEDGEINGLRVSRRNHNVPTMNSGSWGFRIVMPI